MFDSHIDSQLADIQEECRSLNLRELPDELLVFIRKTMAYYAIDCCMDSKCREEAEVICFKAAEDEDLTKGL